MNDIIMEVMAKQMTAKQGAEEKPEDTSEDPIKKNSENKVEMLTNKQIRKRKKNKKRREAKSIQKQITKVIDAQQAKIYAEIVDVARYFPGFIINHHYHILYEGAPPKSDYDRQKMAIKMLKDIISSGTIQFSPIVKCPETSNYPFIDGLPEISRRSEWRSKDVKEIICIWPNRLSEYLLAIFDSDYCLAQQKEKSGELEKLYDQFMNLVFDTFLKN